MAAVPALRSGLIVSVQASSPADAMCDPAIMARVAQAVVSAGAVAIRCGGVGGVEHIRAVRRSVRCPVIGLTKRSLDGRWITPSLDDATAVMDAGADIVAFDAVIRSTDDGRRVRAMVAAIHAGGRLAMADIASVTDARGAIAAGADLIATTMAGYVAGSIDLSGEPDLALVRELIREGIGPVVAEGRYHSPGLARAALDAGAFAVVVGSAITSPGWLTYRFVSALDRSASERQGLWAQEQAVGPR